MNPKRKKPRADQNLNHKCVDCSQPILLRDLYVVRNSVWAAAGMNGWSAGWLHLHCLEKRLGRKLEQGVDLLSWHVARNKFAIDPDYPTSPEFLEH